MKSWLKLPVTGVVLFTSLAAVVIVAYLLGWKTGTGGMSQNSDQTRMQPAHASDETQTERHGIGIPAPADEVLEAVYDPDAVLRKRVDSAWSRLRWTGDPDLASAHAWDFLRKLRPEELATAFAQICDLPGGEPRRTLIHMSLRRWAQTDPAAALAACVRQFRGEERLHFMSTLMGQAAQSDPSTVFHAYREHLAHLDRPHDDAAVFPLNYVFREWAQQDFDQAWAQFEQLTPKEQRYALTGMVDLLKGESQAGQRLLQMLNDSMNPELLQETRRQVAGNLARRGEIDAAEQWLGMQDIAPETLKTIEQAMARNWAEQNPRDAAEWLLAKSVPAEHGHRLRAVIHLWAEWEPTHCAQWLREQLSHGAELDQAMDMFSRTVARKDPAMALVWAAAISDPELRLKTAGALGKLYKGRFPDAAALISNSNLSLQDKTTALDALARGTN